MFERIGGFAAAFNRVLIYRSFCLHSADIPADFRAVANATLCTVLGAANGATVATVEHLLCLLYTSDAADE